MSTVVKAAGLVVFRRIAGKVEFLLLQASYPPYHWTPPKGHVDPGEDEFTAALRETEEEANLKADQLTVYEDCHETLYYEIKDASKHQEDNRKQKSVKYWLALLKNAEDVKLSDEHQNSKWVQLEEAVTLVNFVEMGSVIRNFSAYIDKSQ